MEATVVRRHPWPRQWNVICCWRSAGSLFDVSHRPPPWPEQRSKHLLNPGPQGIPHLEINALVESEGIEAINRSLVSQRQLASLESTQLRFVTASYKEADAKYHSLTGAYPQERGVE